MAYEYLIEVLTTNAHKDSADLTRKAAEWGADQVQVYWAGTRREALLRRPADADAIYPTALVSTPKLAEITGQAKPNGKPKGKPGRKPKVKVTD